MFTAALLYSVTPMVLLYPAPREPELSDKGWGFLGLSYQNEVQGRSIRVSEVYPDTPAMRAGIREGDIIAGLNGDPIPDTEIFTRTIVRTRPSTMVELDIVRDGKPQKFRVRLGSRPDSFPHPFPEQPSRPEQ